MFYEWSEASFLILVLPLEQLYANESSEKSEIPILGCFQKWHVEVIWYRNGLAA